MSKYLVQGSYTDQGLKGLLKEGGSKRRAMVEQLANDMGEPVNIVRFTVPSLYETVRPGSEAGENQ